MRDCAGRGADVARASAEALPFARGAFAGARADRVFQHLAEPSAALAEMVRVVEPGGRVVVADPDQGSLVIHLPGVRPELVDRVRRLRRDVGYRNGTLARALPDLFAASDLRDITVEAFPLVLTDVDAAFGLPTWIDYWHEHFADGDAAEWAQGVETRPFARAVRLRAPVLRGRGHEEVIPRLLFGAGSSGNPGAWNPSPTSRCPTTSSRTSTPTGAPRTISRSARST